MCGDRLNLGTTRDPKSHGRWFGHQTLCLWTKSGVQVIKAKTWKSQGYYVLSSFWALGPGPRALGPVGPLIAAARWKEAPVEYNCCCTWIFSCCNWIFSCCNWIFSCCSWIFSGCSWIFSCCNWIFRCCNLIFSCCNWIFSCCDWI